MSDVRTMQGHTPKPHGDFTGREKERLDALRHKEIEEASRRMGMMTAPPTPQEDDDDVIDYTEGVKPVSKKKTDEEKAAAKAEREAAKAAADAAAAAVAAELAKLDDDVEEVGGDGDDAGDGDEIEVVGEGGNPEPPPEPEPEPELPDDVELVAEEQVVVDDTETIRVVADVSHVVIGRGTDYSFRAGKAYKVPRHVATHLRERGLLR